MKNTNLQNPQQEVDNETIDKNVSECKKKLNREPLNTLKMFCCANLAAEPHNSEAKNLLAEAFKSPSGTVYT